jgi:biotin transport system substrate-specific component
MKEGLHMKLKTKEIILCGMFAALIAVGAFIKIDIPLPLYTMHFTLQWFFVLMAGFLLGEKLGSISVMVYILIGLMGVPVFAAGGGLTYIFRPGFGFLLGFIPAAFLIGFLNRRMNGNSVFGMIIPAAAGEFVYYTVGAVYFYLIKNFYVGAPVSWSVVIVEYCLITVLPDFLLCVFAAVFCYKLKPHFQMMMGNYKLHS